MSLFERGVDTSCLIPRCSAAHGPARFHVQFTGYHGNQLGLGEMMVAVVCDITDLNQTRVSVPLEERSQADALGLRPPIQDVAGEEQCPPLSPARLRPKMPKRF